MQKVKHLEYEHGISCQEVKRDATVNMTEERDHHVDTEKDNLHNKNERKDSYSVSEKANIAEVEEKEVNL